MDTSNDQAIHELIGADLRDSLDEELELELEDHEFEQFRTARLNNGGVPALDRHVYFKELFRLQGELVKLQDWVQHNKLKVVVIFEGRDSAGKGRRHQAHHPAPQSTGLPRRRATRAERA